MGKISSIILRFKKLITPPLKWAKFLGVNIGTDNLIGKNHWSSEPYLITIGNHCQLTNARFFTHGGGQAIRDVVPDFDCFGKIVVGDYVYIGTNSLVMPGVTIGNHVIVAAGSVVTKSVPDNMVVAGNPAKIVCHIEEYLEKNISYNLHTKQLDSIEKKKILMSLSDDKFIKKKMIK